MKSVAIIIPCRNEARYIGRCLDSILSGDYDQRSLDIVVVDGMSTDGTREIVAEYQRRHGCIRLLDNPARIKPVALNLAIRATSAEIVMRIDAHATYAAGYVSRLVAGLEAHQADNIGGIRETHLGGRAWDQAVGIAISHPFAAGNAYYRTGVSGSEPREVDTVFCGCYRRDVFDRIGYFNEELIRTQDREFNARLVAHGGRIIVDPAVRCTYFPRTGLMQYARWTFQGAYWVFYARRFTNTRMSSLRNLVPALFVLWQLCAAVCWAVAQVTWPALVAPLAAYFSLAMFFAVRAAWQCRSVLMAPMLLTLFAVTHYAYGVGAACGFVSGRLQKRSLQNCLQQELPRQRTKAA